MATSIYLSGGWAEHAMIATYARRLEAHDFVLACDWMRAAAMPNAPHDADVSREVRNRIANTEINTAVLCNVFWLFIPQTVSRGAWTEFGAALVAKYYVETVPKRIVVSGEHKLSLFADHDGVERFDTHEEAYEHIVRDTFAPPLNRRIV
jgi:hypothetical protein